MSDIVERLRRERKVYNGRNTFREEIVNPDGPEAVENILALREEGARLRSVLEKIASCDSHHPSDVVAIARAALATEQTP